MRKTISLILAALLLAALLPLSARAVGVPADGGPLQVEISTCKKSYTLLSTIEYAVTITNTSGETICNVSAEVLLGRDLTALAGGSFTKEKSGLDPGES